MIKKISFVVVVLAAAFFTWNCEKDDICDENTSTTPRLILHFYDAANPTIEKNVTNLKATATGAIGDPLAFNAVPQIELPLNPTAITTSYSLILNSTNTAIDNEDLLTFNYATSEVYVSRACGYKVIFQLDPATPFVYQESTDGVWMQSIEVTQLNVQNENEVHISVYF